MSSEISMIGRNIIPDTKPLQRQGFPLTVSASMVETASGRARARLKEEIKRGTLTQTDISVFAGWSQSKVSKILHGQLEMTVDDLEVICRALHLSIVEAVRDHGLEFCAEMTPTELRIHDRIRQLTPDQRAALMTILDVKAQTRMHERRALPKKANPAKALHGGA